MSSSVWGNEKTQYFRELNPNLVLDAVEDLGFETTGRVLQLPSLENRVYEVEIDNPKAEHISENFLILKFYRPGRWSIDQIKDEHEFLFDLIENDIQAIAPLKFSGESVFTDKSGLFYTIFPKQGGRSCVEWDDDLLKLMGRLLARVHNTGLLKNADHRLKLDVKTFGEDNLELILNSQHFPMEFRSGYQDVCNEIFDLSRPLLKNIKYQRVHGDCHHGNILLKEDRPFLIDFDDMSIGPRVQDLWMIIPGRDHESLRQKDILIDAYLEMSEFDFKELKIIETLRALRIIHFSAWISHRFDDGAFQNAFPQFGTGQYWEKEVFDLKQQITYIKSSITPGPQYQ